MADGLKATTSKSTTSDSGENNEHHLKREGFLIDISKKRGNWLTVGELICSIRKPIATYVDEVIKAFHENRCKVLPSECEKSPDCKKEKSSEDLCGSCKQWYRILAAAHKNGKNSWWHVNCDCTKWPKDHWEVAKFFMPSLGSNRNTVKDAKSTDLSSLLNVLEWTKNEVFLDKKRVKVKFVRKLRNQVRNIWAHSPEQEMTDDEKAESFAIATDTLKDLESKFSCEKIRKCQKRLESLKSNGVIMNVIESVLRSLVLQRRLLEVIKEEITKIEVESSSDKSTIEEHEQKLKKLESALSGCSQRMSDFKSLKENINKHFNAFQEQLESFCSIPEDIREIRKNMNQIYDNPHKMNKPQKEQEKPPSSLPNRVSKFTARETEINKVISLLNNEGKAVVSLHGGPGFGKSAIAIEVSHKLSKDHKISVFFSQLNVATTVDEMVRRLCLDVGVNYKRDDPKSSLVLWLKNVQAKVIFVMDGIDNLLEENNRRDFDNFMQLIGMNRNCQMITTSRLSYSIPRLLLGMVDVKEMDDKACMELLGKRCCVQDDILLQKLAELCGNIPLAMCIAASQVEGFEGYEEFLEHLEKEPVETLRDPMSNQFVDRAINMSYDRLNEGQKGIFVRLAVFDGSFSERAASDVIEKDNYMTQMVLDDLVRRSLIKKPTKHRYSIHVFIKHFLQNQLKGENDRKERARAEALMIKYYLKLGHDLTLKTYSKDGYKPNRDALKQEAHHIQNVLKICCQKGASPDILDCLAESEIYNTSARFFALLARTIIPGSIVQNFLERCAQLGKEREQRAIKIEFDCLLVGQERRKSTGKSDRDYNIMMEKLQGEFKTNEDLRQAKSLYAHYLYHRGRYLTHEAEKNKDDTRLELQIQARKQMEESLELRNILAKTAEGIADKVYALLHVGNACKIISKTECLLHKVTESKLSLKQAQEHYEEAIVLSQDQLGDHELTAACYKSLGDLFLRINIPDMAKENYTTVKEMRVKLGLDASKRHVSLLNKLGISLTKLEREYEAVVLLENARDMAEELADSDKPTLCKSKVYASLAFAYNAVQMNSEDAVSYAEKAMEYKDIEKFLGEHYEELREIANSNKMETTD